MRTKESRDDVPQKEKNNKDHTVPDRKDCSFQVVCIGRNYVEHIEET
ncbi:MAG: hypothetical protein LGB01_06940 [Sulfurovum sp.]|nr:hypothetical protein [Sulfurovum sp.]